MRRVVITGIGAITPLGVGIEYIWPRLLESKCGIVSLTRSQPENKWHLLPSTVAGLVPEGSRKEGKWNTLDWLARGEERRMAKFTQYAIAATEMALEDSGWRPKTQYERERTGVCLGSGIGNLEVLYDTSVAFEQIVNYTSNYQRYILI